MTKSLKSNIINEDDMSRPVLVRRRQVGFVVKFARGDTWNELLSDWVAESVIAPSWGYRDRLKIVRDSALVKRRVSALHEASDHVTSIMSGNFPLGSKDAVLSDSTS